MFQLGDTTCTDQGDVDERDVVHHELCQFRPDVSWTSVDETLNVRSVVLARLQVCQGVEACIVREKKSLALPVLATRLCRFTISRWLSQAVKGTNANERKIASGTL